MMSVFSLGTHVPCVYTENLPVFLDVGGFGSFKWWEIADWPALLGALHSLLTECPFSAPSNSLRQFEPAKEYIEKPQLGG